MINLKLLSWIDYDSGTGKAVNYELQNRNLKSSLIQNPRTLAKNPEFNKIFSQIFKGGADVPQQKITRKLDSIEIPGYANLKAYLKMNFLLDLKNDEDLREAKVRLNMLAEAIESHAKNGDALGFKIDGSENFLFAVEVNWCIKSPLFMRARYDAEKKLWYLIAW